MAENKIPRRLQLNLNEPAEISIREAILEVESLGADPRLTEAVVMLSKAKDLVSDIIDERLNG